MKLEFQIYISFILLSIFVFTSCNKERERGGYYEIDTASCRQFQFVNDNSIQTKLIRIDDSTHFKIGGFISDYFLLDSSIVMIKRFPPSITNLDMDGKILWNLVPDISDYRFFENIGTVHYDKGSAFFEVFDYSSMNIYSYSLEGAFIDRRKSDFKFNDKIKTINDCFIYDSGDLKSFLNQNDNKYRILEKCSDSTIIYENGNLGNNGTIPFNDYAAFIRNQTEIFYHPDFSDTIYSIKADEKYLQPEIIVKILPSDTRYELLNNDNTLSKYQSLIDNQIPFLNRVGILRSYLFGVYVSGGAYKNFIIDLNSNRILSNSKHIVLNGITLRSPFLIGENSILVQMPDYEFDLLNSLRKNEMTEDLGIEKMLDESKTDIGGMAYILIK